MDQHFTQMALGFQTPGTSLNHPPEIGPTGESFNSFSYTFDPDITRVPFMNNQVTNTNETTATNNNEGNLELKSNAEENENKTNEPPQN